MLRVRLSIPIILVLVIGIFGVTVLPADIIKLRAGNDVFGQVLATDSGIIKIRTPMGLMELPETRVINITKEPEGIIYSKFGKFYLDRKDYEKAVQYYQKALEIDPDQNDYKIALNAAQKAKETAQKNRFDTILEEGNRCLEQGRYWDAFDAFSKITTASPGEPWETKAKSGIAKGYLVQASKAQDIREREKIIIKVLELDPESAAGHYEMGLIFLQNKKRDQAREEVQTALNHDANLVNAIRLLGLMNYEDKEYLKASDLFERLKTASPDLYLKVKSQLVTCYLELGKKAYQDAQYDESRLWLEKAVNLDPYNDWSLLWKTQYQIRKRDMDSTSAEAHFSLGLWCQDKKLNEEALEHFKAAYQIDSSNYKAKQKVSELNDRFAGIYYQSGQQSFKNGNFNKAIENFNKIIQDYPESSYAPDAKRLIGIVREQWAEFIYRDASNAYRARYYDRAHEGFTKIIEEFSDTHRFLDAQQSLKQVRGMALNDTPDKSESPDRLKEIDALIASTHGADSIAWLRIKSLSTLTPYQLEYRLHNLSLKDKTLMEMNLDKVVYLFYNPLLKIDKLTPMALKYSLPVRDKSKIRSESDYVKLLQLSLLLAITIKDEVNRGWMELAPYFGSNRNEVENVKPSLGKEAQGLIEERNAEVCQILNLKR